MAESEENIILMTDSYKVSHHKQYPPKTEKVYSYFESRGGEFDNTVFFGLQYFIKKYLTGRVVTQEKIDEARDLLTGHLGSEDIINLAGWEYILKEHAGRLPVEIKAVPEGTVVPTGNVLMTVENTDPNCFWLTNYLETLLVQVWYPTTVATLSREMKKMLRLHLKRTGSDTGLDFMLHDFGFRGVSSVESAMLGGAAHLLNFRGTDTLAALVMAKDYYSAGVAGFSIPASEHSTMTSWNDEAKAMENMLDIYTTGLVACVSDSYDIYNACENIWGDTLKDKILNRDGVLVVRPDSGDPCEVVVKCLNILGDKFGYETNEKGYKVLNPKIRMIQGDGCDYTMVNQILTIMAIDGWAAENLAFGMGGALLQKLHRDTLSFAFKCSAIKIDGEWKDVFKNPITMKSKASKKGQLMLRRDKNDGTVETKRRIAGHEYTDDVLQQVFLNGELKNETTFDDCIKRAEV